MLPQPRQFLIEMDLRLEIVVVDNGVSLIRLRGECFGLESAVSFCSVDVSIDVLVCSAEEDRKLGKSAFDFAAVWRTELRKE